ITASATSTAAPIRRCFIPESIGAHGQRKARKLYRAATKPPPAILFNAPQRACISTCLGL
ncbi:MAG: hypothetical protein ABIO58_05785, partial [Luteimonas sp.]